MSIAQPQSLEPTGALNVGIGGVPDRGLQMVAYFRRFALALATFAVLPPLLLAALVVGVDPYYVFGSPSWRGFNAVRPYYEPHVLVAKPYQVRRQRPAAVALGSSRVEVGIDPRHAGWVDSNAFNFALPASNSYALMVAFLHAQKVGAPLKQAVAGLDFFSFNINFPLGADFAEQRFAEKLGEEFVDFLNKIRSDQRNPYRGPGAGSTSASAPAQAWNEALYLAVNPDVAAAVARGEFKSGREHYVLAGRAEHREGASVPADWDEKTYLQAHPDVAIAVTKGSFVSGYHHYLAAGRAEGRLGGFRLAGWNEDGYLAANPDARIRVALGIYRSGFLHYAAVGKRRGYVGGLPASNPIEAAQSRWPALNQRLFQLKELFQLVFSATAASDAIATIFRQSEPADFDDAGMRVWHDRGEVMRKLGGNGAPLYSRLSGGGWRPWLVPPKMMYCFTDPDRDVTPFDPFRFMLRRAYAEGTDLRLFVTPNQAAIRTLLVALGLGERYEFWLKELVRINEEEAARAGRQLLPLWDFSAPNTITREPIPLSGDLSPMRWYWEFSHYRKETGDLILDRIFDYHDPARALPPISACA
jgi:hypothetical protein